MLNTSFVYEPNCLRVHGKQLLTAVDLILLLCRLLDVLALRKDPNGLTGGKVLMNGEALPQDFRLMSGYVVQVSRHLSSHFIMMICCYEYSKSNLRS